MKHTFLLVCPLVLTLASRSFAKDNDKAFVGISFGPSLPAGNYAGTAGGYGANW